MQNAPKKNSFMSVTTEIMTDEFLQRTLQLQKEEGKDISAAIGWNSPQQLTNDSELLAFQRLCNAFVCHENELLNNLLENMNLSQSWADVILPIVHKVTEMVRPDVKHADDVMDIRRYVQFKKVCGGRKEDCRIVNGVACTKNIANRSMKNRLKDPKILLISSGIDYQRSENRFLSLEPLMLQGYEYLRSTVSRIGSLQPDLVLVEKTVTRLAQMLMLEQGITLVIDVKPSVMERVARCTQAVPATSADTLVGVGRPQLGLCHHFYVETFKISDKVCKNLIFFDGCAIHLGCTVLLRGGQQAELIKVKKIISFLTFVAYNWRLERSYHIDVFAMPPAANCGRHQELNDVLESPSESEAFVSAQEESDSIKSDSESPTKIESNEKKSAQTEVCENFSDPLQSYLARGEEAEYFTVNNSNEKLVVQFVPDTSKYSLRACLDEVRLSASPFIKYTLPYLETEPGKCCALRNFFPQEIYWSCLLHRSSKTLSAGTLGDPDLVAGGKNGKLIVPKIKWKASHNFTNLKMVSLALDDKIQTSVADYRRRGGRLDLNSGNESYSATIPKGYSTQQDTSEQNRIDAFDPFRHQKLSVLFCSYSALSSNSPCYCVNPWVVNMDMYGNHDISLGMFLERYCFRKTYHCPARNCNTSMLFHLRKFVHEDGCITISSKELENPIVGSGDNILMWNWCSVCKTEASPIVPMSADTWSLSFAKYLDLRFHGQAYERRGFDQRCQHSLHHDFIHYYAQHNIISWFKYSQIKLWEIFLPATSLSINSKPKTVHQLIDDVKVVAITGHGVYSSILEALVSLKETSAGSRAEDVVTSLLDHLKAERVVFRSKIEEIQINLTVPTSETEKLEQKEMETFLWKITDSIAYLRGCIAETIQSWNVKLHDMLSLRKKEEKLAKQGAAKVDGESHEQVGKVAPKNENEAVAVGNTVVAPNKDCEDTIKLIEENAYESSGEFIPGNRSSGSTVDMSISGVLDELTNFSGQSGDDNVLVDPSDDRLTNEIHDDIISKNFMAKYTIPSIAAANEPPRPEHLEKSKLETSDKNRVVNDGIIEEPQDVKMEKKLGSNTVKTIISHLLTGSAVGQVIQSPWMPTEHYFLSSGGSLPLSVHESEPSSVVAFALSSHEYKSKLADLKISPAKTIKAVEEEEVLSKKMKQFDGNVEDVHVAGISYYSKTSDGIPEKALLELEGEDKDREKPIKSTENIEVQFGSSSAKFHCRVYFAERFRQLRALVLTEPEEFYVRSISRCVAWNATGGKSGSTFCKTFDDRFVVKEMSKFEIQSFLDFAPNYFEYIRGIYQGNKPTVLAKIVGVYRVGYRNSSTNTQSKMHILIMENLFYERNITQKFDLKGSIRNRLANISGKEQEDLVLLDENLVNMACENPLYIRPHTKTVLTTALANDSKFLSTQMVMDYSLLVGFDEPKNELVVGVIDYIRTFTWDKKIENFVKSSGILGGQGKMPTVVSPEEYQRRFCEAMDRYFLLVPDRWMDLGLGLESN